MNLNKNKFHLILSIICVFSIAEYSYSQSGWYNQNSGIIESLNSVNFINSNTGWTTGNSGKILKTTNGGINWNLQEINFTGNLNSAFFINENTGFTAGDKDSFGYIFKTSDGGINWYSVGPLNIHSLKTVFFINDEIGFTGEYIDDGIGTANIYKTTNSGISWNSYQTDYPFIYDIQYLNESTGWLASGGFAIGADFISKTINGGSSWNIQVSGSPPFHCVFFIDSLNGWVGGRSQFNVPSIIRSTNGGVNWTSIFPGTLYVINDIDFVNKNKGWAAGEYQIIQYTSNSGLNWINQTSKQLGKNYNSVYFTDSLTGWVVGDSGVILKTTTGGVLTGFSNSSSEIPDEYFLSQNYPNPFNPVTNLEFGISKLGFVSLKIYDVLGNEVANLVSKNKQAGKYEVEFDGSDFPSGIYFYRLEVDGNHIDTKRMILLK